MLQLNEQQLKELEIFLIEIPFKYANPIFQFFEKVKKTNELIIKKEIE